MRHRSFRTPVSVATLTLLLTAGCSPPHGGGGSVASEIAPYEVGTCGQASSHTASPSALESGMDVRGAAQRSLDFLTRETIAWQNQHQCMGCHVQGVTAEALSIGFDKQYDVDRDDMSTVFHGLLDLDGGVRTESGHAHPGVSLRFPSRAFAGASLARYDALVDRKLADDLFSAATDLLPYQGESGEITTPYSNGPVAKGDLQGTYQAIMTWKQAYARSADDRWLTAIARSEAHLQHVVDAWSNTTPELQDVNYALLGLLAAGVGSTEAYVVALQERLIGAQNEDGGWSYALSNDTANATPLTTGQTLYTLRMLGMNDSDPVIARGITWLLEKQNEDGGWSHSGAGKAEAMWAVLGLVATDVLSVNVTGVRNGVHVGEQLKLAASAEDNDGVGVARIEVAVDDIVVWGECGDTTTYALSGDALPTGPHTIDVIATNQEGKKAMRRFMVYAGDTYLTQLGSDFSDGGTVISMRDIAPPGFDHNVELQIFKLDADNQPGDAPIHTESQSGAQGPVSFFWKGDEAAQHPDYLARINVKDAAGERRQSAELAFVHQSAEYQQTHYGQVSGRLHFDGDDAVANTVIELVDEKGRVVQSTRSTSSGNYRFRNVKSEKKYKVRVKKDGFAADELEVAPAAGEDASLDMLVE